VLDENYEMWFEGVERVKYPRTVLPSETEVLIIGGGMAGVTSAYLLAKTGKKVVLLEKGELGRWITSATTAFLTGDIDMNPDQLIRRFGIKNAALILESHRHAIDEVEKIIISENIECEFVRCTNYMYANTSREERYLEKITKLFNKIGVASEYKKDGALRFNDFGYIEMPGHAKFHAIKYLTGIAKLAVKYGAIIAENTEVLGVEDKVDFVNVEVKDVGIIKAKKAVSATYTPFKKPESLTSLTSMYIEYVLEYKLPRSGLVMGTYEDTLPQYNYFRIDNKNDFDRMIIGGADHLDVLNLDKEIGYKTMRDYAKKLFKDYKLEEVRYWSGHMLETNDGLAFIGNIKNGNLFYIFGFSGNGMTYSYIAGKILLDDILSIPNPYSEIYRVDRKISWWKTLF
jgi:glycine/D-amino acid oxidase-like deaminating enzyme